MKIPIASLFGAALLANAAIAESTKDHRRLARRGHSARRAVKEGFRLRRGGAAAPNAFTTLNNRAGSPSGTDKAGRGPNIGAEQNGNDIISISATVNVPQVDINYEDAGGASSDLYGGTAMIGIGGASAGSGCSGPCDTGPAFQMGVMWSTAGNDEANYYAWYEWLPGPMSFFSLDVSAGDSVSLKLSTSSSTSGTAYISNANTGQSGQNTVSGPALIPTLGQWAMGSYSSDGGLVQLASWSPTTFSGCSGADANGTSFNLYGTQLFSLNDGAETTASCFYPNGASPNYGQLNCNWASWSQLHPS